MVATTHITRGGRTAGSQNQEPPQQTSWVRCSPRKRHSAPDIESDAVTVRGAVGKALVPQRRQALIHPREGVDS
jgi:hypothetical protein